MPEPRFGNADENNMSQWAKEQMPFPDLSVPDLEMGIGTPKSRQTTGTSLQGKNHRRKRSTVKRIQEIIVQIQDRADARVVSIHTP